MFRLNIFFFSCCVCGIDCSLRFSLILCVVNFSFYSSGSFCMIAQQNRPSLPFFFLSLFLIAHHLFIVCVLFVWSSVYLYYYSYFFFMCACSHRIRLFCYFFLIIFESSVFDFYRFSFKLSCSFVFRRFRFIFTYFSSLYFVRCVNFID